MAGDAGPGIVASHAVGRVVLPADPGEGGVQLLQHRPVLKVVGDAKECVVAAAEMGVDFRPLLVQVANDIEQAEA